MSNAAFETRKYEREDLGYTRTFRVATLNSTVYAYERRNGKYTLFTFTSAEPNEHGFEAIDEVLLMEVPSVADVKLAITAHALGVDIEEHQPGDVGAHKVGRVHGFPTWAATPSCQKCGRLADGGWSAAEAREEAWEHWREQVQAAAQTVIG
jgi:hypothetical protein